MGTENDTRGALLAAAENQLIASVDGEIATRSVCEVVGVTQPVLYRIFGDKSGLLNALAERGLERYALRKAALETSGDPVLDLRNGWEDHMTFAGENAALYRLMFTPRPWAPSSARDGVLNLLRASLNRVAAVGGLSLAVDTAAAMLLSANVGLALNRIENPAVFGSTELSHAVRDAVLAAVLVETGHAEEPRPLAAAAARLAAQLELTPARTLANAEAGLLQVWLGRLAAE